MGNPLRKMVIAMIGGSLVLLGAVLIILPGPAWLPLPIGLAVLSIEYPWARRWLKLSQRQMKQSALWLDKRWANRKG